MSDVHFETTDEAIDNLLMQDCLKAEEAAQLHGELKTLLEPESRRTIREARHDFFKSGDTDAPDAIKNSYGEVCLAMCRRCRQAEAELEETCPVALNHVSAWLIFWRSLDRKGMGIVRAYRNKLRAEEDLALLRQTLDAERSYEMEEYSLYE